MCASCATTPDPEPEQAPATRRIIEVREPKQVKVYPKPLENGEELGVFGARLTLRQYLERTLKEQYFSLDNLYAAPPDDFFNMYYIQLKAENAVLHLAKDVTHYHADPRGLAVGLTNGNMLVWSGWSCPGVTVPGSRGLRFMSWNSASPVLAACEADGIRVRLFDLRHCAQVHAVDLRSRAMGMALSPKGTWLAVVDEARNLLVGRSTGTLRKVAALRFEPVAMGFSPQEGLLLVLDQGGWVTLWAPHAGRYVDRFRIDPGPYKWAEFKDNRLRALTKDGERLEWDLVKRVAVASDGSTSRFYMENKVLFYRTWQKRPVKKMHLGKPEIAVWHSPATGLLRVHDIDGGVRFYSADDGSQQGPVETGDWRPLDMAMDMARNAVGSQGGGLSVNVDGRRFVIADVIYQKDHKRLLCRGIPGAGFYLWWVMVERPGEYHPHPGRLPERASLAVNAPVNWISLEAPENLP